MHHIVLNACLAYKATLMFLCVGGLYDWEVRAFLNDGEVRKQLARVLAADKQLRPAERIRRYVWVYKHHMAIHLPLMMARQDGTTYRRCATSATALFLRHVWRAYL